MLDGLFSLLLLFPIPVSFFYLPRGYLNIFPLNFYLFLVFLRISLCIVFLVVVLGTLIYIHNILLSVRVIAMLHHFKCRNLFPYRSLYISYF